jgi:lysophospholipase L1-like esterase
MIRTVAVTALMLAASCAVGATTTVPAADPRVARMGRTVDGDGGNVSFAYPGVQLSLGFTGKSLTVTAFASGEDSYLDVSIDGGAPAPIRLSRQRMPFVLATSGKPGIHRVELTHRSETWHGTATVSSFATDGKILAAPALPPRKMLVLGDSITCGEGVHRVPGEKKDSSWWNPLQSYSMLAAKALDAQVHLVCHGGRGLVRSWSGKTGEGNLPDFYQHAITGGDNPALWDHARYDPDLIVSAIGTNDFNPGVPEREAYVQAYVKLVGTLLRNHRKAQIVLTEGPMLDGERDATLREYIGETVKRVGSPRVHAATMATYAGDEIDAHPTGPQHAAMARDLLPQLKAITGW